MAHGPGAGGGPPPRCPGRPYQQPSGREAAALVLGFAVAAVDAIAAGAPNADAPAAAVELRAANGVGLPSGANKRKADQGEVEMEQPAKRQEA